MSRLSRSSLLFIAILIVCGACSDTSTNAWGEPLLVARAPQAAPPGFAMVDGQALFSWVGVDERGVHHDARMASGSGVTLPLPPRQPRDQRLIAGVEGYAHLLWLDADEDGVPQLYSALLLTPSLEVERGPTQIGDGLVLHYTEAEDASGGVFVAYSGGSVGEPSLTLTGVDTQGRPLPVFDRLRAAEMPTFLWQGGQLRLFWIDRDRAMIMGGSIEGGRVRDIRPLVPTPYSEVADRLIDLRAGADASTLYLFWNVERGDGEGQTWYTSASSADGLWSSWALLGSRIRAAEIETALNVGDVQPSHADGGMLSFAAPLSQDDAILPVVGERGDNLVVLYLHEGAIYGEQTLRENVILLAPPHLASDRERNLHVAWSQVGADGSADLYFLSSVSRR